MIRLRNSYFFLISLIIILLDQITKRWVLKTFYPYETHSVLPMANITLGFNTGSAFSFLNNAGPWHHWFFIVFNAVMSCILVVWILRLPKQAYGQCMAMALILGGALGNLIDRLTWSHVIDFIDIYYKSYHWPAFNIADSAICVGAVYLVLTLKSSS